LRPYHTTLGPAAGPTFLRSWRRHCYRGVVQTSCSPLLHHNKLVIRKPCLSGEGNALYLVLFSLMVVVALYSCHQISVMMTFDTLERCVITCRTPYVLSRPHFHSTSSTSKVRPSFPGCFLRFDSWGVELRGIKPG